MDERPTADLLAELHRSSRIPPAELVGTVDKGFGKLDYLGHAAVTDILLAADPLWYWEPFAVDDHGLPKVMYDTAGKPRALWIRLTVHDHTRIGVGTCSPNANDPYKELIGDALRNAAMRFGVALSLWAKEEWQSEGIEAGAQSRVGDRNLTSTSGEVRKENDPRPGNVASLRADAISRHPSAAGLPRDQAVAARAQSLGLTEDERRLAIANVTDGRTESGKELRAKEVALVIAAMEAMANAKTRPGG